MSTFTPICVACARETRCKKNGYFFKDYHTAAIWSGDMYECPSCKYQLVIGVGGQPVVFADEPTFDAYAEESGFELTRGKE